MKKVSAAPSGRTRVVRLVTRFSRGNPRARNGAIQIKGAPNVTRESRAPPAQNENPSSAPVRALPSACRERKAKPSTHALPSQLRARDESGEEYKAVRTRPAKANSAMTPAQNPEIRDHFPCPAG